MAKKLNKQWLHEHINDPYVKQAQKEGYRARAVYKLKEIDETEKLIKPGQIIIDLGSAPGSWSQYVRNKLARQNDTGINGVIVGLDLLPMEPVADVHFIQGDFHDLFIQENLVSVLKGEKADLILSDIAPNLSGIAITDAARVAAIVELALEFSAEYLKPSGCLLVKCFNGSGYNENITQFRQIFKTVLSKKPKASRDKSSEIFLLGKYLRLS